MYKILISAKVMKELLALDAKSYLKIRERIYSLEAEPRLVGSLKLTNQDGYRDRVGNYRILYEIDDVEKTVKILKVGHRKDVYRYN